MLSLNQITLSRGHKILLDKASVTVYEKQKIGLIGLNGCGKSSLFSFILRELDADRGEYLTNPHLRISHLSQELPESHDSALDFVLAGDEDYRRLQQRLARAEKENNHNEVIVCHELLTQTAGYSKPAKAASIMAGLGFSAEEQNRTVSSFSGGWRMRLNLARCLMKPADLLLLDEPTNHLDMEAIFWLENWLKQTPSSIILISHDREFLDAFVTHILHIERQKLNLYTGNYSCFEKLRAQQLALQQHTYEKQQQKINHLMSYVNRFRAKSSKAKQAQSRLKTIAKMEIVAKAQVDSPFSFSFYPCPSASNPLIHLEQVFAGYGEKIILKNINLVVNLGDRFALLGPNGEGKSTLIKTLTGSILPLAGSIYRNSHLQVGYFAQHHLDELDYNLSPVEAIQILSPQAREQTIRDYLGGFNFVGDVALKPIHHFSGGEKARLALAKLVWLRPNLLLLDEPTNHLDLNMRAAIEIALQNYEGALILISHDRHLLRSTVNDFYLVYQQKVQTFKGDLEDYHQWLLTRYPSKEKEQTTDNNLYREKKILQNRIKKLEHTIDLLDQRLSRLEGNLADSSLYEEKQQQELETLLQQQKIWQQELAHAEAEWMEMTHALEEFN